MVFLYLIRTFGGTVYPMKQKRWALLPLILCYLGVCSYAQLWSGILNPVGTSPCSGSTPTACAINWSTAGIPGGIPSASWTQSGATLSPSGGDDTAGIQKALNSCGTNHYVQLGTGAFKIATQVVVPSNCELRGSGANQTVIQLSNTSGYQPIALGNSSGNAAPSISNDVSITGGATAGSTNITVSSASGISVGMYLAISELNEPSFVRIAGDFGNCTWCDGGTGYSGTRVLGQIVQVTGVSGSALTISPALYRSMSNNLPNWAANNTEWLNYFFTNGGHIYQQTATPASPYTCTSAATIPALSTSGGTVTDGTCTDKDFGTGSTTLPKATPFSMSASYAGVSNLQVYANHTGAGSNFLMNMCAYCWISGVEGNYSDADHVDVYWSYFGEIVNSYFSNSFLHTPGTYDSNVDIADKSTGMLVQNNIFERLHTSLMLEWGASGNVFAYNYSQGDFDNSSYNFMIADFDGHGAHPEFNLLEGNIMAGLNLDSGWGSNSNNTTFRNWFKGTTWVCEPQVLGRITVNCASGAPSYYTYQEANALLYGFLSSGVNAVGDVAGSPSQEGLLLNGNGGPMPQVDNVVGMCGPSPCGANSKNYGAQATAWAWGYGNSSDGGGGPFDSVVPYSTMLFHGEYSNITGNTTWAKGITDTLPASFYLSGKPSWWGSVPYPAIGPDVTGGTGPAGHAYAIPAEVCYESVMGGTDGTGSPLAFNANACYGAANQGPQAPTGLTATVN